MYQCTLKSNSFEILNTEINSVVHNINPDAWKRYKNELFWNDAFITGCIFFNSELILFW